MKYRQYLLGVDVGTTGTKALLFDTDGNLHGRSYCAYKTFTPKVGRSEQNAEDWWGAVCSTVRELCANPLVGENVVAISLSTQGGTIVPVDENGNALRQAIVWNDRRCELEKEAFCQEIGEAALMYEKTGWTLTAGLPAMQLRWLKENEPNVIRQASFFLTVSDYLAQKLTGKAVVDYSNAGINQLFNVRNKCYDDDLLNFSGVAKMQLPKIVQSGEIIGQLTHNAAVALGLSSRCILVAGAHDQYAAALGVGAYRKGDVLIGSGTCWVIAALDDHPDFSNSMSQSVSAVPGLWGSLWSLSSGGICLEWLRDKVGMSGGYETINMEVSKRKAAEDGLFFYPFNGRKGGKTLQRAEFVGVDLLHDCYHLARSVMEGIVFQMVWKLKDLAVKTNKNGLLLTGGAAKSSIWTQMLADAADMPVRVPRVVDASCVGAAILAGIGAGIFQNAVDGCEKLTPRFQTVLPDRTQAEIYRFAQSNYRM